MQNFLKKFYEELKTDLVKQLLFFMLVVGVSIGILFALIVSPFVVWERYTYIIFFSISVAIGVGVGMVNFYLFKRLILNRVYYFATALKTIAEGKLDFSQKFSFQTKDVFGKLAGYLNKFVENIKNLVLEVIKVSDNVAETAQSLSASIEEMSASIEEISVTVQDVAQGATKQSEEVKGFSKETENLSSLAKGIDSQVNMATVSSKKAETTSSKGQEVAENAVDRMKEIHTMSTEVSKVIEGLKESSSKIGNVIEFITDIAEQTDLLALNAAIEAARVGEEGKGFAVVADEIRRLAIESERASTDVSELIRKTQFDINATVEAMEKNAVKIEQGKDTVLNAKANFVDIYKTVNLVKNMIGQIADATSKQTHTTNKLLETIKGISAIATETAASMEEVSASVEQQTASVEEISSLAQSLAESAERQKNVVRKFSIKG